MELPDLVRARGFAALLAARWAVPFALLVGASAGCHNGAANGRSSDASAETGPEVGQKLPPPDANCPADAAGGRGCPVNFCGAPKAVSALGAGELAQLGADANCTPGDVCVPDAPTASGDALQLRCVAPFAPAKEFGVPCAKGPSAPNRCRNDALCIEAPAAPGQPFCSLLCRVDGDCPTDAYCLEYKTPLPKGSYVNLGFCTPKSKTGVAVCAREADCPADQGCVSAGARTNLLTCQKVGGAKSLGEMCTDPAQCRSGQCYDRAFHASVNRAFCSGACSKSSDCAADQRCARVALDVNRTPAEPRDDLVFGLCQTLFVPVAADGCHADADCTTNGADTCSTKYGLCYKAGAASGAPCAADEGCALGAVCSQGGRFTDGYCQTLGCAPGAAAGGVDSCPGANATCAQRGSEAPLYACYEGCRQSGDCSRFKDNYLCEVSTPSPSSPDGGDAGMDGDAALTDGATATDGGASTDAATKTDGDAAATEGGGAIEGGAALSICIHNQGV
jgi:hypothetical protein